MADNKVTVCANHRHQHGCYQLSPESRQWIPFPALDQNRVNAAAAWTPRGWWITGGWNLKVLKSSEIYSNDGHWYPGPNLPIPLSNHCLIEMDYGQTFLAGGYDGRSLRYSNAILI